MRFFLLCFAVLLVLAPAVFGLQGADAIKKGSRSRLVSKLKREVVTAKSENAAPFRQHALQVKREKEMGEEQGEKEGKLLMLVERGQGDEKSDEKEVRALLESKEDKAAKAFEEGADMEWTDEQNEDGEEEGESEDEEDRRAKVEDEDEGEDDWEGENEDEDDWEDDDDDDDNDVAPAILEGESASGIIIVEGDDMESLAKALKEAGATDEDIEEIMEEEAAFEELEEELEAEFGGVDEAKAEAAGWEAGTDVAEKAMKQKGADDEGEDEDEDEDMLDEDEEEDMLDEDEEEEDEDEEEEDMLDEEEEEDMLDEEEGEGEDEDEEDEDMLDEDEDEDMLDEEEEEEEEDKEAVAASSKEAFTGEEPISLEAASPGVEGGPEEKSSSSSSRAVFIWALSGIGGLVVLVAAVWKTAARSSSSDFYSMPNTTAYGSDASSQEQPFGHDAEASLTQHYGQYRRVTAHGQESR